MGSLFILCQPVSRVLSSSVIYLDLASLPGSSNLPSLMSLLRENWSGPPQDQGVFGLSTRKVCRASHVAMGAVGSYPAVSPFPPHEESNGGSLFSVALSVPWPKPKSFPLGSTVPCVARTFLSKTSLERQSSWHGTKIHY